MSLASFLLFLAPPLMAPPPPPPPLVRPDWPTARPGPIVAAPDWGDYAVYPEVARYLLQEGMVTSRLLIDEQGRTTDCVVVRSSGHAELDKGHCERMLLIRFEPAREGGRAVPSSRQMSVSWQLGDEHPLTRASATAELRLSGGEVTACKLTLVGPHFLAQRRSGCLPLNKANILVASFPDRPRLRLEVEVSPTGETMSKPAGRTIFRRLVAFDVNAEGDPVNCRTVSEQGEVSRLAAPRSGTCDDVLRSVWLVPPAEGETLTGQYEIRLVEPR